MFYYGLAVTTEAKTRAGLRVDFLSNGHGNRAAQWQPKLLETRMGRSLCYKQAIYLFSLSYMLVKFHPCQYVYLLQYHFFCNNLFIRYNL